MCLRDHAAAAILALLLLPAACDGPEPDPDSAPPDDTDPIPGDTSHTGDSGQPLEEGELTLALITAEANALSVHWETEEPGISAVTYSWSGGPTRSVPSTTEPSLSHDFTLLGIPAETEVLVQATTVSETTRYQGELSANTVALPPEVPRPVLELDLPGERDDATWVLLAVVAGDRSWTLVVDRSGSVVWYDQGSQGEETWVVEPDTARAQLVRLSCWPGTQDCGIERIDLATKARGTRHEATEGHHDIAPLPDGRVAWLEEDTRTVYVEGHDVSIEVAGDNVRVLDSDGTSSTLFSIWEWGDVQSLDFGEAVSVGWMPWTHLNAIDYRASTDSLIIDSLSLGQVIELDASTGAVLDVYGDEEAGWGFSEDSLRFEHQHDANWTPEDTLLLVSTPIDGIMDGSGETVAIEYELDEGQHVLRQIRSWGEGEGLLSATRGGARRLPDGNTLIWWNSPATCVREMGAADQVVWSLDAPSGTALVTAMPFAGFYATP